MSDSGLSTNPVASFSGLPFTPNPVLRLKALPDSAYTITQADSGCLLTLGALGANRTYTLGPVADNVGVSVRVVVRASPVNTATFQGPVGLMKGTIQLTANAAGTTVTYANAPSAGVRSVATTADVSVGSSVNLFCDGVSWHCNSVVGAGNAGPTAQWAFA